MSFGEGPPELQGVLKLGPLHGTNLGSANVHDDCPAVQATGTSAKSSVGLVTEPVVYVHSFIDSLTTFEQHLFGNEDGFRLTELFVWGAERALGHGFASLFQKNLYPSAPLLISKT